MTREQLSEVRCKARHEAYIQGYSAMQKHLRGRGADCYADFIREAKGGVDATAEDKALVKREMKHDFDTASRSVKWAQRMVDESEEKRQRGAE